MMETTNAPRSGKKESTVFCSEVCRSRLRSCLERIIDHVAFEDWLRCGDVEHGIFANSQPEVNL